MPISAEGFKEAAVELEQMGFGTFITANVASVRRGSASKIFLKKNPEDVQEALLANPDLCTPELYETQFRLPASKNIGWHIRSFLVSKGLVSKKMFL